MVLLKSAAAGKLSELWIDTPKTRKVDMAMRESKFETISQKAVDMLDVDSLAQLEWYAEGVNTFVEDNPPLLDLQLAGFDPRRHPWSPVDTMMSLHVMSVLGLADLHLVVEKFLVQAIHSQQVRVDRLRTLFSPFLDALDEDIVQLIRQVHIGKSVLEDGIQFAGLFLPNKGGLGSNAWAVSGNHSASGKPILCADPHLDISHLPAIWYQVEWESTTHHLFGITMPGLPFLVMGGNQNISMGFTYGFGDYYDYYIEEVKDGNYRKADDIWMPVEQTRESIHTKGGEEFEMVTFSTFNGILDLDSMVVDPKHRMMKRNNLVKHYLSDGLYLSRSNALTSERLASGMSAIWQISTSQTALEAAEHASRICISFNFVIAGTYVLVLVYVIVLGTNGVRLTHFFFFRFGWKYCLSTIRGAPTSSRKCFRFNAGQRLGSKEQMEGHPSTS
jgi:acyl-homoserine lactone acylase PvdQ